MTLTDEQEKISTDLIGALSPFADDLPVFVKASTGQSGVKGVLSDAERGRSPLRCPDVLKPV